MLVLPPPSFGFSPHHRAWAGTITLSLETFVALVTDVAESLHRTGFKRLLIVNGHGGNQGPLTSACTALASRGLEVGYVNYMAPGQKQWLEVLPGAMRGVGHACCYETALQLALRPADAAERIAARIGGLPPRLEPSYAMGNAPDPLRPAGAYWAPIFAAGDVGYVGDPAAATKAAGEALLEADRASAGAILRRLRQCAATRRSAMMSHSTNMVAMRDGIRLATDVYLPDTAGPFPVIMERTPYGRNETSRSEITAANRTPASRAEIAAYFTAHGYAVVYQDTRGRYGSEGRFVKYLSDGEDGFDTCAWLRDQPWCDGRICTMGLSYARTRRLRSRVSIRPACSRRCWIAAASQIRGNRASASPARSN